MKTRLTILFVFSLWNAATFLGFLYLNTQEWMVMLGAGFAIGLFALFISPMASFALLIAYVLGNGFYSVGVTWGRDIPIASQSLQIWKQCVYSLAAVASWYLIYSINKARGNYLLLEKEVAELRKLEPVTGILTYNEFMDEAKLLIAGMRRRNETAYVLVFAAANPKDYRNRVVYEKLSKLLLETVRVSYDLVGHAGSSKLIVFLSNTGEEGVRVVVQRLLQYVKAEDNLTVKDFTYGIHKVADDFAGFKAAVSTWKEAKHHECPI